MHVTWTGASCRQHSNIKHNTPCRTGQVPNRQTPKGVVQGENSPVGEGSGGLRAATPVLQESAEHRRGTLANAERHLKQYW
eukprot:14426616-Alexandrium_andersonii.AAC.1